ncbi:MAG: AAA family ATPase [Actinomycetota bacterium]|nr:AAA family ATPase [Actinomycetota bacterium]
MLWAALEVVRRGAPVLIFDAENGLHTIAARVEVLGPDVERGDELLYYYPFVALPTTEEGRLAYEAKLDRIKPALVCFDSWISFLASNGLDENSSNDITTFAAHYIQPARSRGVATLMLDHIPHSVLKKSPSVWPSAGVTAPARVTSPPLDLSLGKGGGTTFVMMATKERNFSPLKDLSLEELVPKDNFYRRLEEKLDLSFVRELVGDRYASVGRPSVDPVVFFLNVSRECLLRGCSS